MTKTDFLKLLDGVAADLRKLSVTKGVEYANDETDQLANFKRLAQALNTSPEVICSVYLTKHLDAIQNFVRRSGTGQMVVTSEPIRGRILDAILYLVLLRAIIEDAAINPGEKP